MPWSIWHFHPGGEKNVLHSTLPMTLITWHTSNLFLPILLSGLHFSLQRNQFKFANLFYIQYSNPAKFWWTAFPLSLEPPNPSCIVATGTTHSSSNVAESKSYEKCKQAVRNLCLPFYLCCQFQGATDLHPKFQPSMLLKVLSFYCTLSSCIWPAKRQHLTFVWIKLILPYISCWIIW